MKNIIIKQIKKYLYKCFIYHKIKDSKTYYFIRWLIEIVKDEHITYRVYSEIASFLLLYNYNFQFTDIFVIDNTIYIYTQTPGDWIGQNNNITNELEKQINCNIYGEEINDFHIRIIGDLITSHRIINFYKYKILEKSK